MEKFENQTTPGNEQAIKRGLIVPDGGVNLAYTKSPEMTPDKNVVIIDTSRIVEENSTDQPVQKLMYANSLGVLEDEQGNQLVEDEFPAVTDVFRVDEDWSQVPGSEYDDSDVLPFVHVSRYFHVDFAGLTMGSGMSPYKANTIKVVSRNGQSYVDENGKPRYKIMVAPAMHSQSTGSQGAYRVHAFVDSDANEDLYLIYTKVELDNKGYFKNEEINYRELLNPQRFFEYRPEESEVADPINRGQKWYSTKPISLKEQILGIPTQNVNGYKVYVPRKAINDPRIFQLFRWRLSCTFEQDFQVQSETEDVQTTSTTVNQTVVEVVGVKKKRQVIKVAIIITSKDRFSFTPFVFLNLNRSHYNRVSVQFINPMQNSHGDQDQEQANYWFVDFDTCTHDDLAKFDMLIWSPSKKQFDFGPYLGKVRHFTEVLGKTIFIDTNNYTVPLNLDVVTSSPVAPATNTVTVSAGNTYVSSVTASTGSVTIVDVGHPLVKASSFSGWDLVEVGTESPPMESLTYIQKLYTTGYSHYIGSLPGYKVVLKAARSDASTTESVTIHKAAGGGGGNVVVSSIGHLFSCSALFSHDTSVKLISENRGTEIIRIDDYQQCIDSVHVEGAMKIVFNAVMLSVRGKILVDETVVIRDSGSTSVFVHNGGTTVIVQTGTRKRETIVAIGTVPITTTTTTTKMVMGPEQQYGSSWTYSSPWQASWVIRGDALSDLERAKYDFSFLPIDVATPIPVWQRKLSDQTVDEIIEDALTPDMKDRIQGATRNYTIEVTNSNVSVPHVMGPTSFPYAWTDAWTPDFTVPVDIGPHIIKSMEVEGDYEAGQYTYRQFPSKPYKGQVRATYDLSSEWPTSQPTTWRATGTATETITIDESTPPSTQTTTSEIAMSWWTHGCRNYFTETGLFPEFGLVKPSGIELWTSSNYYATNWGPGNMSWPYWGHNGLYQQGSTGDVVRFIQNAMNFFHDRQFFGLPYGAHLVEDGIYGPKTAAAVLAFQRTFHARYLDGVVDAETWSIIGHQTIRSGRRDWWYGWAYGNIDRQAISDSNAGTVFARRSWVQNGPAVIWDLIKVAFCARYKIHAVTVVPYVVPGSPPLMIRSVDIRDEPFGLYGYDSEWSMLKWLPHRAGDNQPVRIDFSERWGTSIIIGLGMDGPAFAQARVIGVRDIIAHAEVDTTITIPGQTNIVKQTKQIPIWDSGTASVVTGRDVVINPTPHYNLNSPTTTGRGEVSNIQWTGVTCDNPNVDAHLDSSHRVVLSNHLISVHHEDGATFGSMYPDDGGTYYSMTNTGRVNPVRETGWINKADGVKLLCDISGNPVGFPPLPTAVGANNAQRHYAKISLVGYGNDPTVQMAFYDKAQQEFIVNAAGEPEIPYIDYVTRGPHNVYIGVVSTYELDTQLPFPSTDDAPKLPHRWILPVYGVSKRPGSRITLEPLPATLGAEDVWPIAVRTGEFDREVAVRSQLEGPLTNYLSAYQGTSITAHYSVPEADIGGWSTVYGYPNADVKDEHPRILDDNLLQVRQPPILTVREPGVFQSDADPVRPVFVVSHRDTLDSPWVDLTLDQIEDYNVSTGEIYLNTPMTDTDPWLWKVTYTSERRYYYFKRGVDGTFLNLNPYPGHTRNLIGSALYIYVVPEYVKDAIGNVIPTSVQDRTLRHATSPNVFDPIRPEYDPLAVQLGTVYISTALDVNDLTILDTRRRGGGAKDSYTADEVVRLVKEASTYWDIGYGAGMSYQKGGFVIVRLPSALKGDFTESEIIDVIERNITAGVRYKIEDLEGNDWAAT